MVHSPSKPRRRWLQFAAVLVPLTVAALPLPIYPAVLLADIMGLAGEKKPADFAERLAVYWLLYGTLVYPGVYAFCVFLVMWWWQKPLRAIPMASVPLLYLCALLALIIPAQMDYSRRVEKGRELQRQIEAGKKPLQN